MLGPAATHTPDPSVHALRRLRVGIGRLGLVGTGRCVATSCDPLKLRSRGSTKMDLDSAYKVGIPRVSLVREKTPRKPHIVSPNYRHKLPCGLQNDSVRTCVQRRERRSSQRYIRQSMSAFLPACLSASTRPSHPCSTFQFPNEALLLVWWAARAMPCPTTPDRPGRDTVSSVRGSPSLNSKVHFNM